MTDWRDLPWRVRSDETARMSARAHADAFEDAPRRLGLVDPKVSRSASGRVLEHVWNPDPMVIGSDDYLVVTVEDEAELCHFDLAGHFDGVEHDVTIRCSIDLLRPSIDDALLAIAVRTIRAAADSQGPERGIVPMEPMDAVRIASLLRFDWSTSFEAVEHAASPLGPALIAISGQAASAGMPDPRPLRPNALLLRVTTTGGLWLGPEHASCECDGFDAIETLRIHRALGDRS